MAKLERIYTVPLGDAYAASRNCRVPRAMKLLRAFVARHMKAEDERIVISEALNKHIWEHSIQKPPRRVKVRLIKEEDSIRAYLADEKVEVKKKAEEKKKEEKTAEPKKEEKAPEKTAVSAKKADTAPLAPAGSKRETEAKEHKAEQKPPSPAAEARKDKK
jgi:large subunit ribosomal protein L31e